MRSCVHTYNRVKDFNKAEHDVWRFFGATTFLQGDVIIYNKHVRGILLMLLNLKLKDMVINLSLNELTTDALSEVSIFDQIHQRYALNS